MSRWSLDGGDHIHEFILPPPTPTGREVVRSAETHDLLTCRIRYADSNMTTPHPPPSNRPRLVDAAFWCFLGGAVIMIVGGLMAATATFEAARATVDSTVADEQVRSFLTIYQVNGVVSVLAAAALAFLAGRARRGDARFRLATLGLSFAIVVVVVLLAVGIGVMQPLAVLSLLPILVGGGLLVVPGVRIWYESEGDR